MAVDMSSVTLDSLPNEVFVQILSPLSTHSLLALTTVSHRFYALVLRILHYRLRVAASLPEYQLMLECFHPGSQLSEPHVFCKYIGTDGLAGRHEGKGSLYEDVEMTQRLEKMSSLYSRFRPDAQVQERSSGARLVVSSPADKKCLSIERGIDLEEFEDFSQLCVLVNLVKVMPGTNLLLSAVTVEDGVIRLFRDWLKEKNCSAGQCYTPDELVAEASGSDSSEPASYCQMIWVDGDQNVGLKVRVRERKYNRQAPVLIHPDEDVSVSYQVDIEELHVRTIRLLLTLEKLLQEQRNYRKAVIFTRSSAI